MKTSKRALLAVAALALLTCGVAIVNAAAITVADREPAVTSTPFDAIIDRVVAQRIANQQFPAALALVAREQMQMQFLSLSKAEQQGVLAATQNLSAEQSGRAMQMLNQAVVSAARDALAEVQKGTNQGTNQDQRASNGPTAKLGFDGDFVFVATAGPCRVADSRFGFGPLGPSGAQQLWAYDGFGGYNWGTSQGGTGTAGVGNCVGTVYTGTPPVSVVATVSVINTTTNGALQAWNGGTTLSGGAVVNWLAGERLSNTTVIPVDRSIIAFPGSGAKRDFALNNNSPGFTDYVVDVVGYFIVNTATALDCQLVLSFSPTAIPSGTAVTFSAPACPTGYTPMGARSAANTYGLHVVRLDTTACLIGNFAGGSPSTFCDAYCCRVPGR